ncbi:MAG: rubrerythrin family protein [Hydrogenothermus sp.]|nr:MAG: rubrerythrin family protein [Hydrogenothermus sp.]
MDFIKKAKEFYINEIRDYEFYLFLSKKVKDEKLKDNLIRIANMERGHANFWKQFLEKNNVPIPNVNTVKLRKYIALILNKLTNPVLVVSFLELGESGGVKEYYDFLTKAPLSEEEKEKLKKIIVDEIEHETFFAKEAEKFGISNVRDFVLGMNDGLVEILGAVTGLSAVYVNNPLMVAVSGSIVGVAGALSMGIGAFISVRSQRQVNQALNEKIEILFDVSPSKALDTLKEHLEEMNIPPQVIEDVVKKIDDKKALAKLLIKEDDENEIRSGLFTGFAYLFGVLLPVLPYFFAPSSLVALPFSILFAGLALGTVGFIISVLSGIDIKKKVMEMVVAGFSAAGLSYLFGKAIQAIFGIDIDV